MAISPGQIRPWRNLAAFVGIVGILYALVFFTGDGNAAPKLGIDLQGGTRVTLEARTETGAQAPEEQLIQAQEIIQERVNDSGVSGAEVVLDGDNLTITAPGEDGEQVRNLGQTAQLRFREVIGGPAPTVPAAVPGGEVPGGESPGGEIPGGQNPGGAVPPGTSPDGSVTDPGTPPADPAVPPADPVAPAVDPAAPAPVPPQGAADPVAPVVESAVEPVANTAPLQDPTPPPAPDPVAPVPASPAPAAPAPGSATPPGPADPDIAAAITAARETRQSTDPAVQEQALLALDCTAQDPLRGYDDPTLPLVACDQDGTAKYLLGPSFLEGTEIATAQATVNSQGAGYVVLLTFESAGQAIWADYTTNNIGKRVAFTLDGEVVSAPSITVPIFGQTEISGQFTQEEAQQLASVLRYGSLPLSFTSSEAQTVSATLGLASLQAGLIAGGVGLLLVFVYCLFYYRVLGVLTILSLALSAAVVYAVLVLLGRWIGFTLDLAGVAGFIVAIGITADSFVIFFERLKDEMREGRSFRSAVPRGWVRARRTILSADAVSFLASAVLYVLAVGQVKGFAFTLGLSTVLDLIVVFLVTHPLVALAANSKVFSSPRYSGLGSVARLGADKKRAEATAGASKGA